MRSFLVRLPSGCRYWTVLDEGLNVVVPADAYLQHLRLGRDAAESTTRTYAGALVLYLRWCELTGRDWRSAAAAMPLFITWLRFTTDRPDVTVVPGPGAAPVRGPRRVNTVLAAVREFLRYGVTTGEVPGHVLGQLYEVGDARDLPAEVRGEEFGVASYVKARHRLPVPDEPVTPATDEEILALLRACRCRRRRCRRPRWGTASCASRARAR
jgi:integrase/recombinase XerD